MPAHRPGYTLFEIVLVLAILVILAAVSYPSLDAMYVGYRLTAATDQVRAAWAEARARSVEEGRPYRFAVVLNKGNFRVAPDSGDFWAGGEPPAPEDEANPPLVRESTLPRAVRFATPDTLAGDVGTTGSDSSLPVGSFDPSLWQGVVTFLPDGTTREDVEITFHTRGGRPLVLRMRALTGVVSVKTLNAEGTRP